MKRDSLDDLRAFSADCCEFETAHLLERLDDVSELSRKVVVNEKNLHRQRSSASKLRPTLGPESDPETGLAPASLQAILSTRPVSGRLSCDRQRSRW